MLILPRLILTCSALCFGGAQWLLPHVTAELLQCEPHRSQDPMHVACTAQFVLLTPVGQISVSTTEAEHQGYGV